MADLAGGEVVDAVLKGVDLVDTGDFTLVEVLCGEEWSVSKVDLGA